MYKVVCKIVLALSTILPARSEPTDDHGMLAETAEWAIGRGNISLLEALLQAGLQIDEPLEDALEYGCLHFAALYNKPRVVDFLLDNGADASVRATSGDRPIDLAIQYAHRSVCTLLTQPEKEVSRVAGVPKSALEEIARLPKYDGIVFASLNGQDAPADLVKWLQQAWKDVRPGSHAEMSDSEADGETGQIRDQQSLEPGAKYSLNISETDTGFEWRVIFLQAPLAGFRQEGRLREEYGYWIRSDVTGGDF